STWLKTTTETWTRGSRQGGSPWDGCAPCRRNKWSVPRPLSKICTPPGASTTKRRPAERHPLKRFARVLTDNDQKAHPFRDKQTPVLGHEAIRARPLYSRLAIRAPGAVFSFRRQL